MQQKTKNILITAVFILMPLLTFTIFGVLYDHMVQVEKCDKLATWPEKVTCRNKLIECTKFKKCLTQPSLK